MLHFVFGIFPRIPFYINGRFVPKVASNYSTINGGYGALPAIYAVD
jgi:hypothetical protein